MTPAARLHALHAQQQQRRRLLYWHGKQRHRDMRFAIADCESGFMTDWCDGLTRDEMRALADGLERMLPGRQFAVVGSSAPFPIPAERRLTLPVD